MSRKTPAPEIKMKRIWSRKSRKDKTPLMEDNNNQDTPDRHSLSFSNPFCQNSINVRPEDQTGDWTGDQTRDQSGDQTIPQSLDLLSLCAALRVSPDVVQFGSGLDLDKDQTEVLIQESVHAHLPQSPSDLETELQRHLQAVQSTVLQELLRLNPLFEHFGLMKALTQNYHRALITHMKDLLLKTSSSRTCLQLLRWTLTSYLSQMFLHPDLQSSGLIQHLDLVLLSDWTQQAQDELLDRLKVEVWSQLDLILSAETQPSPCDSEEDYIRTYVDVIQCIDAAPSEAQTFSSCLSLKLSQLCLDLLLRFTQSYRTFWSESLNKKKWSEPEVVTFFKILKTCKEIKNHIQTKYDKENLSVVKEIVSSLEEIETFTLEKYLKVLADFTESALKKCFRISHTSRFLITELEKVFTLESSLSLEEHEDVMSQSYRLIVSLYAKHLTSFKLHKLRRSWSQNVESSVSEDAHLIYNIFKKLCPAVEKWMLLDHISELLETSDLDTWKFISALILKESNDNSCTELTPQMKLLLLWVGLSRSETKQVLSSVQDQDQDQVRPKTWCMGCY